ncbi:hypothetical protein KY284_010532 [Solanum tuberosum]|nr:hypothetical protein KY284_010532 [Solanum tuberosum]
MKGDHVNPKRVLEEAYKNTNSKGSSTACIITLNSVKNTIVAANVDNPSVAQEMELNIEKDDILMVGTDGMLDNIFESEIEELVERAIDQKLKAEE